MLLGRWLAFAAMSLVFVGAASTSWEWARSSRPDGHPPPRPSSVVFYLINQGILAPLIAVCLAALGARLHPDRAEASWSLGQLGAGFVAFEAVTYGLHRLMHRIPWLFRMHRIHHGSHELGWLDAFRQHPLEFILFQLLGNLPAVLLFGQAGQLSLWVNVGFRLWTAWLHARAPTGLGPLEYVFTSPRMHHRHHRARGTRAGPERRATTNYGGMLSGFDWLCGTARR